MSLAASAGTGSLTSVNPVSSPFSPLSENLAKWAYYLSLSITQYWYQFGTLPVAKSSFAPENSVR
jgi:hypothetical protein